jgi:predicted nucleotidyltransferase component of viral defense system
MIKQSEIQKLSELYKVPKSQIDKDWVLSYLLYAIVSIPELKNIMTFKGGTCLKKCYFPNYRFSEDLDLLGKE